MVDMATVHAFSAELHGGFLTLAFIGILGTALCQIVIWIRESLPKFMSRWAIKSRGYLDATAYVATIAGVLALFFSAYTGSNSWPIDALVDNSAIRNKITLTVFATVLWSGVLIIRWRFGRSLWTCPPAAALYTIAALVAMSLTGLAGSLGAHLTKGGSILDFVWQFTGINILNDILINQTLALIIIIASIFVILAVLIINRLSGISKEQLGPRKCTKWSKWDEPTTGEEGQAKK
jgi:hypothetical protein